MKHLAILTKCRQFIGRRDKSGRTTRTSILDMHCHTKEGSLDAKASVEEIALGLAAKGFDGMLIADHNSYKGYDAWCKVEQSVCEKLGRKFVALKGIEYDTKDAGHILVILPDEVTDRFLEHRGMPLRELEKHVHMLGGVMGPAHPYGTGFFALMHTKTGRFGERILDNFDFVEGLNSCSKPIQNRLSRSFANRSGKVVTCGSDVHKKPYIGTAYTCFEGVITCNNDLIRLIHEGCATRVGLIGASKLFTRPDPILEVAGIIGYWVWNKALAYYKFFARRKALQRVRMVLIRKKASI